MEFAGSPNWNRTLSTEIASTSTIVVPQNYLNSSSLLHNHASSLVVIDPTLPNYQQLVAGVQPDAEVLILNPAQDAIAQITQALLGQTGISSLHLVSHGESGAIQLGETWLDRAALDRYQSDFRQWEKSFTHHADILIYGCDVAQGEAGRSFMNQFSQLTGADIAASDNLTGNAALHGDWTLEVKTGEIEAPIAFNAETRTNYDAILPVDLISVGNPVLVKGSVGLDNIGRNAVSGDGRYIVFTSSATISPNDANGTSDVFLYDRQTDTTTLISHNATNTGSATGSSLNPVISYDGNAIAFVSNANDLVSSTTSNTSQSNNVFVWDRSTGNITLVSHDASGGSGTGNSAAPSISDDGSRIAFQTESQLLNTDRSTVPDVYLWDRSSNALTHISRNRTGFSSRTEGADSPVISGDGNYVAFSSLYTNLSFGDTNRAQDIFLWQQSNDTMVNLTIAGNGNSLSPVISQDGSRVAFVSNADNFGTDTNGVSDVFVWTRSGFDQFGAAQGSIQMVSVNLTGNNSGNGAGGFNNNAGSQNPIMSRNGQAIAFTSSSSDLVDGDDNGKVDVFVRNLVSNQTVLVSRNSAGAIGNGDSGNQSLSADGTRIAFTSVATNLVNGDTNAQQDVFVRDTSTGGADSGKTFLISRTATDSVGNNTSGTTVNGIAASLSVPIISSDGSTVAFVSLANNLSSDDTNSLYDGFVIPVASGNATLISRRSSDPQTVSRTGSGDSTIATNSISVDGRYIVFTSAAPEIVDGDTNGVSDVFLRNRQTGTTTLISRGADIANGASGNASISADGRYVVFTSAASNLVSGDNNNAIDIFWVDRQTQQIRLVSRAVGGTTSANADSLNPVLSGNGLFVAFTSTASNLVSDDTNNQQDVFVWNSQDGSIAIVSRGSTQSNGTSEQPAISSDGRYVAFVSAASNLANGDTNNQRDVFVWDRQTGALTLASRATDGTISDGDSYQLSMSQDGRTIAFTSTAKNLAGTPDADDDSDVFVRNLDTNTTTLVSVNQSGGYSTSPTFTPRKASNPMISGNGKFVVFTSDFSDLVALDTNGVSNVFRRDLEANTTQLISINKDGTASGNNTPGADGGTGSGSGTGSLNPMISNDGRYVVFSSFSSDLASGDTNNAMDVFVRDVTSGFTTLVSRIPSDTDSGRSASFNPVISSNGGYIAFNSVASDLTPRDLNGKVDVFGLNLATTVSLTQDKDTIAESTPAGSVQYKIRRNQTNGDLTVKLAIDPSSTASSADYTLSADPSLNFTRNGSEITIKLANGVAEGVLTLTPIDDTEVEDDEVLNLSLVTTPDYAVSDSFATTSLKITDNDVPILVSIANTTIDSKEGNSGEKEFTFQVKLSTPATTAPVTVQYATQNGTADASDFTATSGTLTFDVGGSDTQTIKVLVKGDTQYEPDETFSVVLSNPSTNAKLATSSSAIAAIENDDTAPTITIAGADSITEGDTGTQPYTFTVSLNEPSSTEIKVDYAVRDLTTTSGSDYVTIPAGTLTFTPGVTSQSITVLVNGDRLSEDNEQFQIELSNPVSAILPDAQKVKVGTIVDNDPAPNITIETTPKQSEGTTPYNFVVKLSEAAGRPVTVKYNTIAGTATAGEDFTAASDTLTFAPGEISKTVPIAIIDDTKREQNEAFSVKLSDATSATITTDSATSTIVDNDPIPTVAITNVSQPEGNSGDTPMQFDVTLSNPSDQEIVLTYATKDGTALISDNDYQAAFGTIRFTPGTTKQTIAVNAKGDTKREPNETFTVDLSTDTPNLVTIPPTALGVGTIQNDDTTQPTISVSPASVTEGGVLSFVVSLSEASGEEVRVDFATSDGTATLSDSDYTLRTNETLIFAPNELTKTITVQTTADNKFEDDETVNLTLKNAVNTTVVGTGTAIGTILNDDTQPKISVDSVKVSEGNDDGTFTNATFTVSLSNPSSKAIAVNYATIDGTAQANDGDYETASGKLTFAPGITTQPITVRVRGDRKFEPDETFSIQLSSPSNADLSTAPEQGIGTILNDDSRPTITIDDSAPILEGNTGTTPINFTVRLSNPSSEPVTVKYVTKNGTADETDYVTVKTPTTLTFAPGQTEQTITLQAITDTRFELDEAFTVELSDQTNAQIGRASATATIRNDDAPPKLSIAAVPPSQPEGNSGITPFTFEVTLSEASSVPITVSYTTVDGTATIANNDYVKAADTLTFAPGETKKTITVNVLGDTQYEGDETFQVTLSNPANATLQTTTATTTILEDDTPLGGDNSNSPYDILWRNRRTGENMLWQPSGSLLDRELPLVTVPDPTWQAVGAADFNGDGNSEILWHQRTTGETVIWQLSSDLAVKGIFLPTTGAGWEVKGIADFNRDRNPDILWRNTQTGENVIWFMRGTTLERGVFLPKVADPTWQISTVADFDNDGNADIFWSNSSTGETALWLMNGGTIKTGRFLNRVPDLAWRPVASGDFNRDGFIDLLWRNSRTGENVIWLMQNGQLDRGVTLPLVPATNWQVEKLFDFDGDQNLDILWRNTVTQEMVVWFMNKEQFGIGTVLPGLPDRNWSVETVSKFSNQSKGELLLRNYQTGENRIWRINLNPFNRTTTLDSQPNLDWEIQGTADFDRNGSADIVWRNLRTRELSIWLTNKGQVINKVAVPIGLQVSTDWKIRAIADFSGDGNPELVWSNSRTGEVAMWLFNGTQFSSGFLLPNPGLNWQINGAADINGDRNLDLIWRNTVTGEIAYWLFDRTQITGGVIAPAIDLNWQLKGTGDFNRDGKTDLVWRNEKTGETAIWWMNGTQVSRGILLPSTPLSWDVAGIGDYNRDGQLDLLWRDRLNGTNAVWYLTNGTAPFSAYIPSLPDLDWQVQGINDF